MEEEKHVSPHVRYDQHIVGANRLVRFVDAITVSVVVADHLGLLDQLHHPASSLLTQGPKNVNKKYKNVVYSLLYASNK